jgi:hypothetical protein
MKRQETKKKAAELKTYTVRDNSYIRCLNGGERIPLSGQVVEVVVQPFEQEIQSETSRHWLTRTFIIGKCKEGLFHQILYKP